MNFICSWTLFLSFIAGFLKEEEAGLPEDENWTHNHYS